MAFLIKLSIFIMSLVKTFAETLNAESTFKISSLAFLGFCTKVLSDLAKLSIIQTTSATELESIRLTLKHANELSINSSQKVEQVTQASFNIISWIPVIVSVVVIAGGCIFITSLFFSDQGAFEAIIKQAEGNTHRLLDAQVVQHQLNCDRLASMASDNVGNHAELVAYLKEILNCVSQSNHLIAMYCEKPLDAAQKIIMSITG
jgi:ABC-type multidrug transport system fused ATPase/permease subunit